MLGLIFCKFLVNQKHFSNYLAITMATTKLSDRPPGELNRNSQLTNILGNYLLLPPILITLGAIGKIVFD